MKLAFMHIPKTGGISLERAIMSGLDEAEVCDAYYPAEFAKKTYADMPDYALYQGHFNFDFVATLPDDYRKITVVRKPEDLLLSLYNHIASRPAHAHHEEANSDGMTFAKFVDSKTSMRNTLSKYLLGADAYKAIWNDSGKPVKDRVDEAVEQVKKNLASFDAIGLTPRLNGFASEVSKLVDREIPTPKRENANATIAMERDQLTQADKDVIARATRLDRPVFKMIWGEYFGES
ncbi:MAG: sulfotransferase family 2 domain-containing protein [Litorimonas sp.]